MSSVHRIKLLILGLLLFPAALFAQTSTTGRIDEGPLAARPTVCTPGDYYVSTDTNPVVEYKCSTGNNWIAEATGGGGGGNPGGNNGDTQCKSGTTFIACSNNPEIRYVSSTGNDANSGLTWDTAKATVFAALEALPNGTTTPPQIGTGTIYVGDNVWWNPDHTKGLWILDPNDPNYATPPAGWIRGNPSTFWPINILGKGCGTLPAGNTSIAACVVKMSDSPGVGNGGTNNPAIWLQGAQPTHIENINVQGSYGRCMALGIDSTGNRSNLNTEVVNKSFKSMACAGADGVDNAGRGRGPVIDIGPAFFDTFDEVFASKTSATNQSLIAAAPTGLSVTGGVLTVTFTAANTAFFTGEGCGILGANAPQYNFSVQGTPGGTGITVVSSTQITMPTTLPNGTSGGGFFTCDRDIPIVLDAGTVAAGGEIIYRDAVLNGGGIKQRGGQLTVRDVTTEGDFTHCIAPVIWFIASGGGLGQGVIADYIAESDQCPTVNNNAIANPVKVEGAINPENIQITSTNEFPYTEGSLIYRGDSNYALRYSPLARGEWGVVRGHLEAQTDVQRHAPMAVRYPNFEHPTSANWVTTGLTIVNGLLDNDGGTNAVSAVPSSGTASLQFSNSDTAFGTWNTGDIGICGVWMKSTGTVDPYQGAPALSISCTSNGGTLGFNTCNFPVAHGDGEWNWYWCAFSQGTGTGTNATFTTGTLTTSTPIVVYAPTFFRIPVADGVTFNEAMQMAYDVRSTASTWPGSTGCVAGTTCDATGPLPHVGVATGNTNCVADWLSQTSLGQLCGTVTGTALTAQNGSAPSFASPGIQDGNSGSPVTTTPYTIQCDSLTTLVDRAHLLRFQSGAAAVTVPLSTATGCTAGFVVSVVNDGAGTLTFSRSSTDTFSIFNGVTNIDGATSFQLTNGQYATLNQGASGIWEVRVGVTAPTVGAAISANYLPSSISPVSMLPGVQIFGCTITNTSNVVSNCLLPSSAAVGWLFHATNGCCGGLDQVGSVYLFGLNSGAENTITCIGAACTGCSAANCFVVSTNATASASGFGHNSAIVTTGPDDTTAATNITNYLNGSTLNGQQCPSVFVGNGVYLVKSAEFNITGAGCIMPIQGGLTIGTRTAMDTQAAFLSYQGMSGMLAPTQDFNFATCTAGPSAKACFFSGNGIRSQNIGVNGGGASLTGGNHNNIIVEVGNDSALYMFICQSWGASDTSLIGVQQSGGAQGIVATQLDGCGQVGLNVTDGLPAVFSDGFVGDNGNTNVNIASGAQFNSVNNGFAGIPSTSSSITDVVVNGTWFSTNDNAENYASGTQAINVNSGGVAHLTNYLCSQLANNNGCLTVQNGGKTYISNSIFKATGSGFQFNSALGAQIFDNGGNTSSGGSGFNFLSAVYVPNPGPLNNALPTVGAGFGTSPGTPAGSALNFRLVVGTGGTATTGTINLPTAPTGWNCVIQDAAANIPTRQNGGTTSTVTVIATSAWGAGDTLFFICGPF